MMIRRQVAADPRPQESESVPHTPGWQAYSQAGHAGKAAMLLAGQAV